jgi:asparagine synthase (glutamine-hydrolysing)
VAEACDPEAVEALYTSKGKHQRAGAWVLLFYAVWHQHHIMGRALGGDAFEFLSGRG